MPAGEIFRWSRVQTGGQRPIKLRRAEDDRRCSGEKRGGSMDLGMLPRWTPAGRVDALGNRLAAFGATAILGQAIEGIAAPFAENIGLGRDDGSDARHRLMI